PCSRSCLTQPQCTSSISRAGMPTRSTSALIRSADRSSARTSRKIPFSGWARPIGVRTASMMTAWRMATLLEARPGRGVTPITIVIALAREPRRLRFPRVRPNRGRDAQHPLFPRPGVAGGDLTLAVGEVSQPGQERVGRQCYEPGRGEQFERAAGVLVQLAFGLGELRRAQLNEDQA